MAEPGEYRKLRVPTYAPRLVRETVEGKYWRRFRSPKLFQQARGAPSRLAAPRSVARSLAASRSLARA